jgi:hypothetical protein
MEKFMGHFLLPKNSYHEIFTPYYERIEMADRHFIFFLFCTKGERRKCSKANFKQD